MNVRELLARSAQFYAMSEAIIDGNRRVLFSEAWDRGIRFANGLLSLGLKPQDKIGVLEHNCVESVDAYIGLAIANMVRVPLYAGSSFEVHSHMLGHTNCNALVVSTDYLEEVAGIQASLNKLKYIIVRDENYEKWLFSQSNVIPEINIEPEDLYIIRHSGGASGLPKGIGITHRNWIFSMRDWFFPLPPIIRGDAFLHVSPMSHASGYMFLAVWAAGGCNIMLPSLDPERCLEVMEQERASYMFVPPYELSRLANFTKSKFPDGCHFLKALMSGGAPIPAKVIHSIRDVFGDVLYVSYGQTEVGIVSIGSPSQWNMKSIEGSHPILACGLPLHFVDIRIMDGDKVQALGQPGEIVVRTDCMMDNYWGQEKKKGHKKWICTGDMGRLDKNGFLYILGRKEDVITIGGIKIYPLEIENHICSNLDVVEAAVVGVPCTEFDKQVLVYCVVSDKSSLKEQEIHTLCRERLNSDKVPIHVKITTEGLPKNSLGKVSRRELQTLERSKYEVK